MIRTIIKISIVLLIIVTLPIGFFLVKEYSKLSNNEKMVERVFSTQLESILFSVNQYSENVLRQWSQSLDQPGDPSGSVTRALAGNLLQNNQAIQGIRFLDLDKRTISMEILRYGSHLKFKGWPASSHIETMREYLKNNYQRLNAIPDGNYIIYCFLPRNQNGQQACQLLVDLQTFIDQNLSSQIQQISHELFYIRIKNRNDNKLLYATDEGTEPSDSLQTAAMWYLPGQQLGIRLKAKTIYELASERSQRDNYLLIGMGLLILLGFLFVILNIRKEIKLAELKSEFVSNVSHEIRTPLSLISMYTETLLLKRVKTEEKKEAYLKTIGQESSRLTDIVNRILNFSKIEKNKRSYRFGPINLNNFIPEVIDSAGTALENKKIDCRFIAEDEGILLYADTDAVKEMLVNLIDNAIKYSAEENRKIEVRLALRHKQIWIEVEDNGIGISAKNQKYIFDQFYRVTEGNLAHKAKGSGLGLNLVKRMMKAHGGSVSVKSRLGEGSTFILKFPVKKQSHA